MSATQANRIRAIVVNYNAGSWLARCLSALLENLPASNITVVDNASSDSSLSATEGLDVEVVYNRKNVGYGAACNQAAHNNKAEHLLLVNPDCLLEAGAVAQMQQILDRHQEAGILGILITDPDGHEQRACRRREPTPWRSLMTMTGLERVSGRFQGVNINGELPSDEQVQLDAVSGAVLMIRRRCFDDLDGFDERYFLHVEDLDLFRRARDAGWKVLFTPTARAVHAKGISQRGVRVKSEWHKHLGMWRYFRQHIAGAVNPLWRMLWPMLIFGRFALMTPWWWLSQLRWRSRKRHA